MTIGESRHAAIVEASLSSIAGSLKEIAEFVLGEYVSKIERIKSVIEKHSMWDNDGDALDEINGILSGGGKGGDPSSGEEKA